MVPPSPDAESFRRCSTCRKEIEFEAIFYLCSVSTCNRPRTGLFFCSLPCWDAHLPEARHREAWAEEKRAPTREAWAREQALAVNDDAPAAGPAPRRVVVAPAGGRPASAPAAPPATMTSGEVPRDVLVVVSKLKAYVKARSGMNTSDGVVDVLSDHVRRICDDAVRVAGLDGRRTVMDRDFRAVFKALYND